MYKAQHAGNVHLDSSITSQCHNVHSARTTAQHALMNQRASLVQTTTHLSHTIAFLKMTTAQDTVVSSSQVGTEYVQYVMIITSVTTTDNAQHALITAVSAKTMSHAQHAIMTSSFSHQTTHVDHSLNLVLSA